MSIVTQFIPIIIFIILLLELYRIFKQYKNVEKLEDYTIQEKTILRRQLLSIVFWGLITLLLLLNRNIISSILNISLSAWKVVLLCNTINFAYISISSIKNRVSVLGPRGTGGPIKGTSALYSGIFILIVMFLIAIFIFSKKLYELDF